ncbi:MAG: hypothetical protein H6730_22510 [Deltaproteobacteria bacterium]|nr:hypothetical protein [Deltaproteobacteria bacterium]
MANFRDIVTALLRDLTRAQDASNRFSAKLAERYRDGEVLRFFPVPNAVATEVELELRFALAEPTGGSALEPLVPGRRLLTRHLREITRVVLRDLADHIQGRARLDGPQVELLDGLRSDDLADELAGRAARAVGQVGPRLFAARSLAPEQVQEVVRVSVREAVLATPEVAAEVDAAAVDRILLASQPQWALHLEVLAEAVEALSVDTVDPELPVIIGAAGLRDLPLDHAHVVRIKAELRDYRWVVVEGDEAQLLPEG